MTKVLGKNPEIAKQVTCKNCSSILEYLPVDIKTTYHRDISGCNDAYKRITCPSCGSTVQV